LGLADGGGGAPAVLMPGSFTHTPHLLRGGPAGVAGVAPPIAPAAARAAASGVVTAPAAGSVLAGWLVAPDATGAPSSAVAPTPAAACCAAMAALCAPSARPAREAGSVAARMLLVAACTGSLLTRPTNT